VREDRFRDRHAVVTGGSSGIGLALVRRLAERGARVSVLALDDGLLQALREERLPGVVLAAGDVGDRDRVRAAIGEFADIHGPVDLLVTVAGVTRPGYFQDLPDDEFERQMRINYLGTLHAVRAVAPTMIERRQGTIVSISSAAGLLGVFGYSAYGPTKYAVRGLCEVLRVELKPYGIYVGCVFPSDVDTPMLTFETPLKPPELVAISGTVRPIPPDRVAAAVIRGIERRQARIFTDARTKWVGRLSSWSPGILGWLMDRKVRAVRRSGGGGRRPTT
jgi:3-dehydrosphinganine reductase